MYKANHNNNNNNSAILRFLKLCRQQHFRYDKRTLTMKDKACRVRISLKKYFLATQTIIISQKCKYDIHENTVKKLQNKM